MKPEEAETESMSRLAMAELELDRERFSMRQVVARATVEAMRGAGNVEIEEHARQEFAEDLIERVARLEVASMEGPTWRVPAGAWQWIKDSVYRWLWNRSWDWPKRLAGWLSSEFPVTYEVYRAAALLPAVPLPEERRWPVHHTVLSEGAREGWRGVMDGIDYRELREHTRVDGERQAWIDRLLHLASPSEKGELWEALYRSAAGDPTDWQNLEEARRGLLMPMWDLLRSIESARDMGDV